MAVKKAVKKATKTASSKKAAPKSPKAAPAKARANAGGLTLSEASPGFTANDLEKSLAFYRDVLGFAVDERWEREGKLMGVSLKAGSVTVMIGQDDWKKGRDRKKGQGFRIYCDTTQDIDILAKGIVARGGTLEPWGARTIALADPDGFKITIGKELKKKK